MSIFIAIIHKNTYTNGFLKRNKATSNSWYCRDCGAAKSGFTSHTKSILIRLLFYSISDQVIAHYDTIERASKLAVSQELVLGKILSYTQKIELRLLSNSMQKSQIKR